MGHQHREGPAIVATIGRARELGPCEGRPNQFDIAAQRELQARRLVDELKANGATLTYRPPFGDMAASFTYELAANGDRQRCRGLIAEAKSDILLWTAFLQEIAERSKGPA